MQGEFGCSLSLAVSLIAPLSVGVVRADSGVLVWQLVRRRNTTILRKTNFILAACDLLFER